MLMFIFMLILTFSHVLMKTIASGLILCVDESWLAIYMGLDMLLFLSLRLVRRDFTYWPKLPPVASVCVSTITRITQKVLTDFTLTLQMRNDFEVGGFLFSFLVVQNHAMTFVAAHLYFKLYEGDNKIPAPPLWSLLFSLLGLFLVSVLVFVGLMDRRYLGTFVTTTTGPQSAVNKFKVATTDEQRLNTFKYHHYYYAGIEDELKALLAENWEDWMANKPKWLTESIIDTVPDEFLPEKEVVKLNASSRAGSKRKLAGNLLKAGGWMVVRGATGIGLD
jgi:hypothetical protein